MIFFKYLSALRVHKYFLIALLSLSLSFNVSAAEITLNLKDADIRALISTVSKFTGKNFIIDPRVKAKVTVVSANTMSQEEVYEVFLSVLQVHGFAAVPSGTVIKIVPIVNAKQAPLPLIPGKKKTSGDALITKIIRLDHVPASQLVPILRPLVPQQGHLAAYNPTNSLIVTDHAGNIQRLLKIIDGVDRAENDELEVIPLEHASAPEIVRIVNSLYPQTPKDAKKIVLAADERTNSILMSGDRTVRLKVRTTIAHLDTPIEDGGNTHVIYLKYAKAEKLVPILSGIQSPSSSRSSVKKKVATKPGQSAIRRNTAAGSSSAVILADEETNALIITADPNTLRSLKAVIRQLDIRRAQVMIEAIITEISTTKGQELGVGMAVDGTPSTDTRIPVGLSNFGGLGGLLGAAASNDATNADIVGAGLTVLGGGTRGNGTRYAMLLRALASDSAVNILSTPSIVTLDNEEAEIIVGENVPFVTGSTTSSTNTNPFQTIERQDVGLTLKVTPQINEGDTIKLDLEQETSNVTLSSDVLGPTTNKRAIKTSVLVDDGGLLVLGGLIEEQENDTEDKVPLLGDIPLIGKLFQSSIKSKVKKNLMVFLRPTILRDTADSAFVTNEKYNLIRSLQIQSNNDELEDRPIELPEAEQPEKTEAVEPELEDDEFF